MKSIDHRYLETLKANKTDSMWYMNGVNLIIRILPEDIEICEDTAGDDIKTLKDLLNGNLNWYCVELVSEKAGIELASTYLGCCISDHGNEIDSYLDSGYYAQMKDELLDTTSDKLKELLS